MKKKPIPTIKENPKGQHMKYVIFKRDNNGKATKTTVQGEYFVLKLTGNDKAHVSACKKALKAYAVAIAPAIPELAADLKKRYFPAMKRQAIIRQATGKKAGQFRFILIGDNYEPVGGGCNETYTQKHNAIKTIKEYFPSFSIVDMTRVSPRVSDASIIKLIQKHK